MKGLRRSAAVPEMLPSPPRRGQSQHPVGFTPCLSGPHKQATTDDGFVQLAWLLTGSAMGVHIVIMRVGALRYLLRRDWQRISLAAFLPVNGLSAYPLGYPVHEDLLCCRQMLVDGVDHGDASRGGNPRPGTMFAQLFWQSTNAASICSE